MIKFFRKIRQNMLKENKFGRYLLYAIGEIILVVIGILIALSINTKREELLEKQDTKSIFEQIRTDLVNDSIQLGIDIKKIESDNHHIIDVLENTIPDSYYTNINDTNYNDIKFRQARSLCTDFINFLPNDKGFELLKSYNNKLLVKDSLTSEIISHYSQVKTVLPEYNKVMVEISKRNIQEYKEYDWYENWSIGKYDLRFIEYLRDNKDNRKRLAEYYSFNSTHESYWKTLKINTKKLINLIDKNINSHQN